jgi:hypothetical protein
MPPSAIWVDIAVTVGLICFVIALGAAILFLAGI